MSVQQSLINDDGTVERLMNHRYRRIGGGSKPCDGAVDKSHGIEQLVKAARKGGEVCVRKVNET